MTFQWQSSRPGQTARHASTSPQSPLTIHKHPKNDSVSTGIVASRVQYLQGFAKSRTAASRSTTPKRREYSRIGFGRRLSNRFGSPASRNSNPHEHTQVETSHSFLGLTTLRTNHEEGHAMADERISFDRTPGIHGQIRQNSVIKRVQYDAVSPWATPSKAGSFAGRQRAQRTQRASEEQSNVLSDTSRSQMGSRYMSQASNAPDTSFEDYSNPYQRLHSRQGGNLGSETSILTTSTTRQSVRDLFKYYGIERPTGLVSSEDTSRSTDEPSWRSSSHRRCHVCSFIALKNSVRCWRCGHGHCAECDALSPIQESRRESHPDGAVTISKDEMHPVYKTFSRENTNETPSQTKRLYARPKLHSVQESTLPIPRKRIRSSTSIEPPSFGAHVSTAEKASQKPPLQQTGGQIQVNNMYSGHRVTTSVKESPFLKADRLSLEQPPRCLPIASPVHSRGDNGQSNRTHNRDSRTKYDQYHYRNYSSSPSSGDDEHGDQRSHVQYMLHNSRKHTPKRLQVPDESDHGYTADDSYIEDFLPHLHPSYPRNSRAPSQTNPRVLGPSPRSPGAQQGEVQKEELVECYGYPKTGHHRQGSVSSIGAVGECQHCLNDCQCPACQNTEHNVRCCVHESHNRVIHHHGTPQKENIATPMNFSPPPPRPPTPPLHTTLSPVRTASTVIPLHLQRKTSPPKLRRLLKPQTPQTYATRSMLKESFSTSKSKKSTLINEASQRQTPPRVSIPREIDEPTGISAPRASPGEHDDDPLFKKEPHLYPLPLFNERTALSPSATNNKSSPASTPENYSSRVSVRCGQDLGQLESYKWSSRRGSVIEGKRVKPPSRGGTPQMGNISPPGSTKASRRLSALFQLRKGTPIPFLNRKLMEHQEQLRRMEKQCDEKTEDHSLAGVREFRKSWNEQATPDVQNMEYEERSVSKAGKRKGNLRLVEKQQSPLCVNHTPKSAEEYMSSDDTVEKEPIPTYAPDTTKNVEEYRLSDDESVHTAQTVEERRLSNDAVLHSYQQTGTIEDLEIHECIWKRMFLEEQYLSGVREGGQDRDSCIRGITVMLHFEGKDDFVFKGELLSGSQLIAVRESKG